MERSQIRWNADARVDVACLIDTGARRVRLPFEELAAIRRIRKPDAAVGMRDHVVGRVEALAVVLVRENRGRPVVLVADNTARQVLARDLTSLVVKRVAVAVVRWVAEHGYASSLFEPAHLHVVADVAEHEEAADAVPRRPLEPQPARPQPLDGVHRNGEAIE